MYAKKEKIYPANVSKHNLNHEKQILILMVPKRKLWYYLTVRNLSVLLRTITSKYDSDFCCMNCLHYIAPENSLEYLKKVCGKKIFWM